MRKIFFIALNANEVEEDNVAMCSVSASKENGLIEGHLFQISVDLFLFM